MKRRSARPFTVEIKHTRSSRTAPSEATSRSPTGQNLWQDVSLDLDEAPARVPSAPRIEVAPAPAQAPVRRVLPSLVPMYAPPSEPEAVAEPPVERLPRVRRHNPLAKPKRPPGRPKQSPVAAEASLQASAPPVVPKPAPRTLPAPAAEPASPSPRPTRLSRKVEILRPGERWKRRLPRVLR